MQVNDTAPGNDRTCRSYLIKYIGSRTGYAASFEYHISAVARSKVYRHRFSRRTIENSTLLASNVTESGSLDWEGTSDLTTFGSGMGDIENGRQETSSPC